MVCSMPVFYDDLVVCVVCNVTGKFGDNGLCGMQCKYIICGVV